MKKDGLNNREYKVLDKVLDKLYPDKKGVKNLTRSKMLKIEHCYRCKYYQYKRDNFSMSIERFKCHNPDNRRENGNYRIINRRLVFSGNIPKWCNLEDYKDDKNNEDGGYLFHEDDPYYIELKERIKERGK